MPRPISMRAKSHFGMIIYKRLTQMGKNQKYLAEKTGFSQLYISEILNGKHNPSIKAIYNISKVTGISIEELTKALLDENQVVRTLTWLKVKEVAKILNLTDSAIKKAIKKNKYEYRHVEGIGRGGVRIEIALEIGRAHV